MPARSPLHHAFGEALRELRAQTGLSQEELALTSGLDRSYVGGIERGERNPSLNNIVKLSEALGRPTAELFELFDAKRKSASRTDT